MRRGVWASVRLHDGSIHRGVVHTVDPETGNVVLLRPDPTGGDATRAAPVVLFAHAIAAFSQGADPHRAATAETGALAPADPGPSTPVLDHATVEARLAALCELLRAQHLPFARVPDGLLVLGCLHIAPPYTASACRCENEIVLDRVVELITAAELPGS